MASSSAWSVGPRRWLRQPLLQYSTESQVRAYFFRHVMRRPQRAQVFSGSTVGETPAPVRASPREPAYLRRCVLKKSTVRFQASAAAASS